jgi:asparagine synthase (glutamine-hydrolysing)
MTTNRCCGIGLLGGQCLSMGLRGRIRKYLLKKLLQRYLPPEMVYRPKQGFGLPLGRGLPT